MKSALANKFAVGLSNTSEVVGMVILFSQFLQSRVHCRLRQNSATADALS